MMIKRKKNNTNTTLRATIMNGKSMTPQMVQNETDKEVYNSRPLKLWNLDAIQNGLNTRGISVTEVLIYVPEFNGISENETVAATEKRHNQNQNQRLLPSRVFQHGILSDGSTYAFEQNATSNKTTTKTNTNTNTTDEGIQQPPPVDRYIGKVTKSGKWVVKATNIHAKSNICTQHTRHLPANAGGDTTGARNLIPGKTTTQDKIYLLSRGEGFSFKNKLVAARDMEEEMNQ